LIKSEQAGLLTGFTENKETPTRFALRLTGYEEGFMKLQLVKEFIIPKKSAEAFQMAKGQVLRVTAIEGPQVADLNAFNLHNLKEHFSSGRTRSVGGIYVREGSTLYSIPGHENAMMTVIRDPVGVNNILGTRCSGVVYRKKYGIEGYKGCQELLSEAIAAYGLTAYDTHDAFSIFMNKKIGEDGKLVILPPTVKTGESIDLLTEMDLLIAISACPSEKAPTNNFVAKSLEIQILKYR
jgi:uncharacterized protein